MMMMMVMMMMMLSSAIWHQKLSTWIRIGVTKLASIPRHHLQSDDIPPVRAS